MAQKLNFLKKEFLIVIIFYFNGSFITTSAMKLSHFILENFNYGAFDMD